MFIYLTHSPFSAKKGSFDEWIPVNLLHLSLPHLVLNLALQGSASQRSKEQKEFQGHLNKTASSHCSQPLISVSTEQTGLLGKRHRKWSFSVDYMFEKLGGKGRAEMVVYTCRQWLKKKKSQMTLFINVGRYAASDGTMGNRGVAQICKENVETEDRQWFI